MSGPRAWHFYGALSARECIDPHEGDSLCAFSVGRRQDIFASYLFSPPTATLLKQATPNLLDDCRGEKTHRLSKDYRRTSGIPTRTSRGRAA